MKPLQSYILFAAAIALCLTSCRQQAAPEPAEPQALSEYSEPSESSTLSEYSESSENSENSENPSNLSNPSNPSNLSNPASPEADFVLLADVCPDIIQEIRYYTTYNFVGERIPGYERPVAYLTRQAAAPRGLSDTPSCRQPQAGMRRPQGARLSPQGLRCLPPTDGRRFLRSLGKRPRRPAHEGIFLSRLSQVRALPPWLHRSQIRSHTRIDTRPHALRYEDRARSRYGRHLRLPRRNIALQLFPWPHSRPDQPPSHPARSDDAPRIQAHCRRMVALHPPK